MNSLRILSLSAVLLAVGMWLLQADDSRELSIVAANDQTAGEEPEELSREVVASGQRESELFQSGEPPSPTTPEPASGENPTPSASAQFVDVLPLPSPSAPVVDGSASALLPPTVATPPTVEQAPAGLLRERFAQIVQGPDRNTTSAENPFDFGSSATRNSPIFDRSTESPFVPPVITDAPEVIFDFAAPSYNDATDIGTSVISDLDFDVAVARAVPFNQLGAAPVLNLIEEIDPNLSPAPASPDSQQPGSTVGSITVNTPTTPVIDITQLPSVQITPNTPSNPFIPSPVFNPPSPVFTPGNPFAPTTSSNGQFTIGQVIDGTISSGDGSNPNEEAPMGRHDAPLFLSQSWNWAQGPSRNSAWGQLGTGGFRFAEFRCAVIPQNGHTPAVPFRVNVRNGAYYQYVNNNWNKAFDVDLTGGNHGGYLGNAGQASGDPFSAGSHGQIQWRREADGSYSAPWNQNALMMHFWAGRRQAPAVGQTAEFLTSEIRLQQPDGQTVDLSQVRVLFQCGIDYYNNTGGQGTRVPGPGIGKYHAATSQWQPSLWVTLPSGTAANSVTDFQRWLSVNTPPNVNG